MAKQCYQLKDPSVNANKFWNINQKGSSVEFEWGRIGTAGQSTEKDFSSPSQAQKEANKKINEKTGKGYKQVPC